MEGANWMNIRSDRQKGMNYTELGRKYHIDPRTAKRYAVSDTRPVYSLTEPKSSMLDPYKEHIDKVERTVAFVRDNFMVGIKYNSLDDLNGQAIAWCNMVNGKIHATTGEIPFKRLKKEGLNPLSHEYIIDRINLRRVQKDCLISYSGNQYSVPSEYVGRDVAVVGLDSTLAVYCEGKQIAIHKISYRKKDMVVNGNHYRRLTVKQAFDVENTLLDGDNIIDFPIMPPDLSAYDEVGL